MANKKPKNRQNKKSERRARIKSTLLSKKAIVAALCFLVIGGFAITKPISHEGTEKNQVSFQTQYKNENGIELGSEKVVQEGKSGLSFTKYKYSQSIFDRYFRKSNITKLKLDEGIEIKPTHKIVLKGMRKWQYMMCSNGTYRYYTNEQFKDPKTGFTSKSPDNCAQNNQGKMIRLADNTSGSSNNSRPSYTPPNCSIVDIPYKTVYQNVSWLNVGQTQNGYGINGFKYVCSDGSYSNISSKPIDKIIYIGTGTQSTSVNTPTTSYPTYDYAAKRKCDGDYSSAKAQLSMAGATGSSVMQQIQSLYAQCLARAGF